MQCSARLVGNAAVAYLGAKVSRNWSGLKVGTPAVFSGMISTHVLGGVHDAGGGSLQHIGEGLQQRQHRFIAARVGTQGVTSAKVGLDGRKVISQLRRMLFRVRVLTNAAGFFCHSRDHTDFESTPVDAGTLCTTADDRHVPAPETFLTRVAPLSDSPSPYLDGAQETRNDQYGTGW